VNTHGLVMFALLVTLIVIQMVAQIQGVTGVTVLEHFSFPQIVPFVINLITVPTVVTEVTLPMPPLVLHVPVMIIGEEINANSVN
jgi:hypothetical protein